MGFPRTRGDGPVLALPRAPLATFPPHTRGWTDRTGQGAGIPRVSPAHAGMDRFSPWRCPATPRFPRTRGDGPARPQRALPTLKFPPHTRGWTITPVIRSLRCRVSPAHAGMDPVSSLMRTGLGRFPRTRGDGPSANTSAAYCRRFPRTRGDRPANRLHYRVINRVPPHTRGLTPLVVIF